WSRISPSRSADQAAAISALPGAQKFAAAPDLSVSCRDGYVYLRQQTRRGTFPVLRGAPDGSDVRQGRAGLPAGSARLAEGEPDARDRGRAEGRAQRLHAQGTAGRLAEAAGQDGLAR